MECIEFDSEKKYVEDFIRLYRRLYSSGENMQNDSELRQLLLGTHTLSHYFTLHKFCIYRDGVIVGRYAITVYPDDDTAYLGFFECENSDETATYIFTYAENFAVRNSFARLVGPVDASFWIKYRLKINMFDRKPYTGEPYNKDYYPKMFRDNGFTVIKHYTSSIYDTVEKTFHNEKYEQRLRDFISSGYEIKSPDMEHWDKTVADIYRMITKLFSDFPIYKGISEADFAKNFESYKLIINFDMVKMAYYKGKAVGFFISIPNYGNVVYHTKNPLNLAKIMKTKHKPHDYVMLYMGVEPEHRGLGKALVQSVINVFSENGLPSIGALQIDGKVTQHYVDEKISQRYEYALYSKEV